MVHFPFNLLYKSNLHTPKKQTYKTNNQTYGYVTETLVQS